VIAFAAIHGFVLALLQQATAPVPDKGMSSAHFVYIPGCIILGLVLGWILGARAARAEAAVERKKAAARAARPPADSP
jgi:uncharacterized membrane protein YbjE (DUF340 family)